MIEAHPRLNTIEEVIADIRAGQLVILMDDQERENEGDLIVAAQMITPERINFMATHARGLICLTIDEALAERLVLPLMAENNQTPYATRFTVSIEAARGVTTGISAADRANTVKAAVAPDARPDDLVRPGHIFPVVARPGGVLSRAGHTEAGCDLAELAGMTPNAVIAEIMNEDGTMARQDDLIIFAQLHGLKIGTIADLIHYRLSTQRTIERVKEALVETESGRFRMHSYRDLITDEMHLAMVCGTIDPQTPQLVRVMQGNTPQDILGLLRSDRWSARASLQAIAEAGSGVLVLLSGHESQANQLQALQEQREIDAVERRVSNYRTIGTGAQILHDLRVKKMRLLSRPIRFRSLSGFDLEILEFLQP